MTSTSKKLVLGAVAFALLAAVGWAIVDRLLFAEEDAPRDRGDKPIPIEVVALERGSLTEHRTFSGALESPGRFVVASRVAGRVEQVHVDLGDPVTRGQVVVELDDDAYQQAVVAAEADQAVARATRAEMASALDLSERELKRARQLHARGLTSDADLDAARAGERAGSAQVASAAAQVTRAAAALEAARVDLGYTLVTADWTGGDEQRVVGERLVNPGDTVAANTPLLAVVELDDLRAVIHVTEESYGRLARDQAVTLLADAWPGETFEGRIARISPVFEDRSRQARVEVTVPNRGARLKPGMFVRVRVALRRVDDATIAPAQALTRRGDVDGVFVLDEARMLVRWRPVEVGIREGERVQLVDMAPTGRVVTLGQQLVKDGSAVVIPDPDAPREDAPATTTSDTEARGG